MYISVGNILKHRKSNSLCRQETLTCVLNVYVFFTWFILQALQRVNECLLEKNPNESLLFDIVLMISDSQQQQQRSRIISSTRHHGNKSQSGTAQWWSLMGLMLSRLSSPGLQVSRFCFCSEDNLIEGLLQNQVHLFLTTDIKEVQHVSHKGQEVSAVAYYSWLWRWRQLGSHGFSGMVVIHTLSLLLRGFVSATGSRTSFLSIRSAQSHDLWRRHPSAP